MWFLTTYPSLYFLTRGKTQNTSSWRYMIYYFLKSTWLSYRYFITINWIEYVLNPKMSILFAAACTFMSYLIYPYPTTTIVYQFLGKSILSITLNKVKYTVIIKSEKQVSKVISAFITYILWIYPYPNAFSQILQKIPSIS